MLNDFLDQILIFGMSTLGGPFSAASCSQHIFFFFLSRFIEKWKEGRGGGARGAGAVQTAGKGEEGGEKGKENAFNLFTVTALCWFQQNGLCAEYFSFLKDPPLYTEH